MPVIFSMFVQETSSLPEGASVPALGLSNKAVFDVGYTAAEDNRLIPAQQNEQYPDVYFSPVALKSMIFGFVAFTLFVAGG